MVRLCNESAKIVSGVGSRSVLLRFRGHFRLLAEEGPHLTNRCERTNFSRHWRDDRWVVCCNLWRHRSSRHVAEEVVPLLYRPWNLGLYRVDEVAVVSCTSGRDRRSTTSDTREVRCLHRTEAWSTRRTRSNGNCWYHGSPGEGIN